MSEQDVTVLKCIGLGAFATGLVTLAGCGAAVSSVRPSAQPSAPAAATQGREAAPPARSASAASVEAEGESPTDYRPEDRFVFALSAGAGFAGARQTASGADAGGTGFAFGHETSWWANDFVGIGFSVEIWNFALSSPDVFARASGVGFFGVLAVPLRYLQPYAGLSASLVTVSAAHVSTGVRAALQPIAGVNAYVSRDVRLFAQWRYVPTDFGATAAVGYADLHAHVLVAGVRWSPEYFHQARAAVRFDLVWWSVLLSVALWTISSLVTS